MVWVFIYSGVPNLWPQVSGAGVTSQAPPGLPESDSVAGPSRGYVSEPSLGLRRTVNFKNV